MKKILALILALVMCFGLVACGGSDDAATTDETGEKTFNLTLAHNLAEDHAVHVAMTAWAETATAPKRLPPSESRLKNTSFPL